MYKIVRYFNQNRKKIYRTIIIIVLGLIILRFANNRIATNVENIPNNNLIENNNVQKDNINANSAITGISSSTNTTKETEKIEQFIKYCNGKNVTEAYDMLSTYCKEEMYQTLEKFINTYYNDNFIESKNYTIQRWSGSTYKVDFKENILYTGNLIPMVKQDYITVIRENEQYKLNINSYIGRTYFNKETTSNNVTMQAIYKDTYMDNEIYTFEVKNNNNFDIYLGNVQNTETIYLVDSNNIKYEAYINEISEDELHIYTNAKKQVKITFSNNFVTGREYSKIVFENIIDKEKSKEMKIVLKLK